MLYLIINESKSGRQQGGSRGWAQDTITLILVRCEPGAGFYSSLQWQHNPRSSFDSAHNCCKLLSSTRSREATACCQLSRMTFSLRRSLPFPVESPRVERNPGPCSDLRDEWVGWIGVSGTTTKPPRVALDIHSWGASGLLASIQLLFLAC